MNQDVLDNVLMGTDDDFLPDGWDGKSDIFLENGQLNEAAFASDGEQAADGQAEEKEHVADEDADVLTTDDEAQEQPEQDADAQMEEAPADGQEQAEVKPSRKLKLKVNHKDEEVDIDAMSDDDLIALLQKGRAFDAIKEAENKRKFREVFQEQVDAGMTDAVARIAAQAAAGGKTYDLEDPEEETEADAPVEEQPAQGRDFVAEVRQLKALYPDFKETPNEVAQAVANGASLLEAYTAYRVKQSNQTAAALKRENAKLKQDAATAAKAPVKGVTGGGKATPPKKDPFEEGFDEALIGW